jgi:superfamily II DNA or RNA helicase
MEVVIAGYAWISTSELEPVQLGWLKSQLAVPRVGQDCSLVNCFLEQEGRLGIAREFFYSKLTRKHEIRLAHSTGTEFADVEPALKVVDENETALRMLIASLASREVTGGIVYAPPGWGKINTTIEAITRLKTTTVILVNSTQRLALWKKRLNERCPTMKVGQLANRKWEIDGCHVVVAPIDGVASQVVKETMPESIERSFGLVVVDQCHSVDPANFSRAIGFFHAGKRLGLSSKPARDDKADKVFEYHLGRRLYTSQVQRLTPKIRRVFTSFRITHPYFNPQLASRELVVEVVSKNTNYNQEVTNQIVQALAARRKIVVFSETFDHLKRLRTEVETQFKDRIIKTDHITEDMLDSDIEAASVADVIFASYKTSAKTLDIPAIDTVVLASPIKTPEAPVGWALTAYPGKKDPVIVDIRADQIPLCKEYAECRDRAYARFYPQQAVAVNG